MKYYNFYIILSLFIILLNNIICNASLNIEDDNEFVINNNHNNNDNSNNININKLSKSHLFLLSIPDCSVEGIVLELGKCFSFESYGCLPSSIIIKANKNKFNKLNSNITSTEIYNENQEIDKNENDYYGIVFYNINCNSHDENEVIEFECKKSKKIKLMGNVKLQCLSSDKDLQPVFLDNSIFNKYYSSSSMEKIKIYEELKPLFPNKENTEDFNVLNSFSNKLVILNSYIMFIIIVFIIIIIL